MAAGGGQERFRRGEGQGGHEKAETRQDLPGAGGHPPHLPTLLCLRHTVSFSLNTTQSQLLVQASLPKAVHLVSFQPYNADQLATTGGEQLLVWRIDRLSDRHEVASHAAELPAGVEPTCHAWFPQGLYVGGSGGELLALDALTLKPLGGAATGGALVGRSSGGGGGLAATTEGSDGAAVPAAAGLASAAAAPCEAEVAAAFIMLQDASPAGPVLQIRATASGSAVSAICVSRDLVIVAGSEPTVRWFTHAVPGHAASPWQQQHVPFELRAEHDFGGIAAPAGIDVGGDHFGVVVLGGSDGCVRVAELEASTGEVGGVAGRIPTRAWGNSGLE